MFRSCITACLLAIGAIGAQAEDGFDMVNELVGELKKVVPEGWNVTINHLHEGNPNHGRDDIHIEVWRTEKVLFKEVCHPNPFEAPTPNEPEIFNFNFNLCEYLSPFEYARLKKENEAIDKRLQEFTVSLSDIKQHGKARAFGDNRPSTYFPENDEEKKRVQKLADYIESHPKHHIGPNCYFKELSFYFFDPRKLEPLTSEEVDAECNAVLAKVKALLSFYEVE
jgi:hypothetical protein